MSANAIFREKKKKLDEGKNCLSFKFLTVKKINFISLLAAQNSWASPLWGVWILDYVIKDDFFLIEVRGGTNQEMNSWIIL